ncbi:MAG: sugar ABC transporter ATP-binding protein [Devosia sp.]
MIDAASARIELSKISKSFAGMQALDQVDFRLYPGEVHALLGENGAGKSTLIKIMTGAQRQDSGDILLDGRPMSFSKTADAQAVGISTVYQEVNLVPSLSVLKNVTLDREPRRFGLISWRAAAKLARDRLQRLNLDIDIERALGTYPVAVQQLIAIARALEPDTRVLVLDEPTASLDATETRLLFGIIRELKAQGIAIVFISHFLDQVYDISDRITVLRNGRLVGTATTAALPQRELISMMLGRELESAERRAHADRAPSGKPLLEASGLGRRRWLEPVSLELHQGEVVGLAGLLGSGRTELVKLIFGAVRADSGQLLLDGAPLANPTPRACLRLGIAFCPEDRKAEGLFLELSVRENIIMALQTKRGWQRPLSNEEQRRIADDMIKALAIATTDAEKPVGLLSGGNQQKVVLARSLVSDPRIMLLDEPTRGIDVGAHAEIVGLIRRLCDEGMALIVATSELDEIVAVADRIAVLRDRQKAGEIVGNDITRERIVEMIAGGV